MVSITLKVDDETAALLEGVARQRGLSRSDVVREGILLVLEKSAKPVNALERFGAAVGCIDEGPGDLSEKTGAKFTSLLRARKARR